MNRKSIKKGSSLEEPFFMCMGINEGHLLPRLGTLSCQS